jgi:hypothetical protein
MGKKAKQTAGTNTDDGATGTNIERLSVQLNNATAQVLHNIMKMDMLHQQWMNYLFVLSFIVVLISVYQIYINFDSNYDHIDSTNRENRDHHHQLMLFIRKLPKPIQLLLHIDYAITTYIMSTCMSIFLFLFMIDVRQQLQEQQPLTNSMVAVFRNFYFRMTQFCFLPTMLLYYYHSKNKTPSILTSSSSSSILQQQFPIVIVYFVIATVCIWFMKHQAERMYQSYNTLARLKVELAQKEYEQHQKQYGNKNQLHNHSTGAKKKK